MHRLGNLTYKNLRSRLDKHCGMAEEVFGASPRGTEGGHGRKCPGRPSHSPGSPAESWIVRSSVLHSPWAEITEA